jgi:hypothetical protein
MLKTFNFSFFELFQTQSDIFMEFKSKPFQFCYTLKNSRLKYKKQNSVDFKVLNQCYFSVKRINAFKVLIYNTLNSFDLKL